MTWKFWKKPSSNDERIESGDEKIAWPTDVYAAATFVVGMYMGKMAPFSKWRDVEADLSDGAMQVAETACTTYQLAFWLWMLASAHGPIVSEFARGVILEKVDELDESKQFGRMLGALIEMASEANSLFEARPPGKGGLEMPRYYFLSLYYLTRLDSSPYFQSNEPQFENDDFGLAECLEYSVRTAKSVFEPMLAALLPFDVATFPSWRWSIEEGAHERHLRMRCGNPLFSQDRRLVTVADVYDARVNDLAEWEKVRTAYNELNADWNEEKTPADWLSYLGSMREKIDDQIELCRGLGTRGRRIEHELVALREDVIGVWRRCFANNPQGLRALEEAEQLAAQYRSVNELVSLRIMKRAGAEDIIPPSEVIPTLLSLPLTDFAAAVTHFSGDGALSPVLANLRTGAIDIARTAVRAEGAIPELDAKLSVLGVTI